VPRSGLKLKKETLAMVHKYKCAGVHVIGAQRSGGFLGRHFVAFLRLRLYRCTECYTIFYGWK
jgi:hypothetical protein